MFHYGHVFRLLHCAASQAVNGALGQMELTSSQGRLLGYLAHSKQAPCAKDIEEEFHLSHPTISGLLSRLEKKNFIEIRPDERDGRVKRIYLSQKGLDGDERIMKTILETEERVVRGFTPEEQEQFITLLTRALRNLNGDASMNKEEPKT